MNKIFKVIWNEARNAYVVVSEIAKNHGSKSCSTKKLLAMLIATGVMTCASMAPAMADNPAPTDTKIKVGDVISIIRKEGSTVKEVVTLTCVANEMPFTGMGQHFKCRGAGYCDNIGVNNICSCELDIGSSQDTYLYLSNTASASTQYYTTLSVGDKVEIYF